MRLQINSFFKFFISLALCLAVGGISGFITANEITSWYATLNKPSFNPPNWIFSPVWTTLYIFMAISLWLIWKSNVISTIKRNALTIFSIQLILNFFWSIIFFRFHQTGIALIEIVLLWIFILLSIIKFRPISKTASYLLIPYLLWVSFASILNFEIWRLN